MLANAKPVKSGNTWAVPAFFVDAESFQTNTSHSNTLEWNLPAPTPIHAFTMSPVQS